MEEIKVQFCLNTKTEQVLIFMRVTEDSEKVQFPTTVVGVL